MPERNPWQAIASTLVIVPFAVIGFVCVMLANMFTILTLGLRHIIVWAGEGTTWALDIINGPQPTNTDAKA